MLTTASPQQGTPALATPVVIDIGDLHIAYGTVQAVRGLSLQVRRGEIFGLLGPNGAGKTSTLSAIEGLVKPQSGRVQVLGEDVWPHPERVQRYLGISLQTNAFFDNLKLWELVRLYSGLYKVFLTKTQILELLARFDLAEKANAQAQELSGGQQQRVALALAICNDPQIVILDEPTTGLDPQARRLVWEVIRQIRNEGRTILLTTHYMEEAQELCNRIGIIDQGQMLALDTPTGLINKLNAPTQITAAVRLPVEAVRALPGVIAAQVEENRIVIQSTNTEATVRGLQKLAVDQQQLLTDLSVRQPDLEDVFIAITGHKIR